MSEQKFNQADEARQALDRGAERVRRSRALLGWIDDLLGRKRDDEDDDPDSSPAPT